MKQESSGQMLETPAKKFVKDVNKANKVISVQAQCAQTLKIFCFLMFAK